MRVYAVFDKAPPDAREVTGPFDHWTTPGGHVLFVCEPPQYAKAEKHLQELGGIVFPDALSGETIGEDVANHTAFKDAGLKAGQTAHSALKRLSEHFSWPTLHPRWCI